jgi:hypothetical protein
MHIIRDNADFNIATAEKARLKVVHKRNRKGLEKYEKLLKLSIMVFAYHSVYYLFYAYVPRSVSWFETGI